ncbi:hypothetical protein EV126DRAFT_405738 [Verticillium dahliae]|nr:hypothetical protein EV126DRAFT_405738 [Verticillium dahliae]
MWMNSWAAGQDTAWWRALIVIVSASGIVALLPIAATSERDAMSFGHRSAAGQLGERSNGRRQWKVWTPSRHQGRVPSQRELRADSDQAPFYSGGLVCVVKPGPQVPQPPDGRRWRVSKDRTLTFVLGQLSRNKYLVSRAVGQRLEHTHGYCA